MPFAFRGRPRRWIRRVPPLYGQHADEVLEGVLGRDEHHLAALRAVGAISARPAGRDVAAVLCVPSRAGEPCAPVRFLLRRDCVVMELSARQRITGVEWDRAERAVAMTVEITDPRTARPVDVRIDVVPAGAERSDKRTRTIGTIARDGRHHDIVGTFLGVVADEK